MVVITLCKRVFSDIFRQICYLQVIEKLYKGTPKILFSEERQNYFLEYIVRSSVSLDKNTQGSTDVSRFRSLYFNYCISQYK